MKSLLFCSAALAVVFASPAQAGDKVLTGPVPDWVLPVPALTAAEAASAGLLPRLDEQARIEGDTVSTYIDTIKKITSPEQLTQMGTLSMNWQPQHGDLTFHRIDILRGGETIDVLGSGEGFSVLRREASLERSMVDGQLTAVKHIEGLQVGDALRLVFTLSESDGTLGGNVESGLLLVPQPAQLSFGRARLVWPTDRPIAYRFLMPGVTATPRAIDAKWTELSVPLPTLKLPEMPKNMPARFEPVPVLTFSSFADWGQVAKAMAPLYSVAGTIPEGSELAKRVDAIAARSPDPVARMAEALRLVQDEVRYQLIALGSGNYVPQTPAETWSKRYGDCKAKTRLLLAIFDRLGIEAEPVLANTRRGDALAQIMPSALAFDHVFVRARVGAESFWLDGTMLGSRLADIRDVPRYGLVLPLYAGEGALFDLPRRAHARPDLDVEIAYDMSGGPHLPAPFQMTMRHAGMSGITNRVEQGAEYATKLTDFASKASKTWTGSETILTPKAAYDDAQGVWTVNISGVAYPDWTYRDGHYSLSLTPNLRVALDAARDRASWRSIPALINSPWTAHNRVVTRLPDGGRSTTVSGNEPAHLTLPAVDWQRTVEFAGGQLVESIVSRESGAEIAPDKLSTTSKAITEAMKKATRVELAASYPQHWDDVAGMRGTPALAEVRAVFDKRIADMPDEPGRLWDRAWLEEQLLDWGKAEADYGRAIALDGSASRYLDRSRLRAKRGDHAGALKDAQTAYELEEGNADARSQLAVELAEAGKVDEGLELLLPDPDVMTDDGLSAFLLRIEVLETGDRHDEAITLLDGALEKRGSSAELRNSRCWFEALRNQNLDSALADCERAIELASDPAGYLDSRALVHFRAGRFDLARADYQAALAAAPNLASSLFMSGVLSTASGDAAKGAIHNRAAIAVYPSIERFYRRFGIAPGMK